MSSETNQSFGILLRRYGGFIRKDDNKEKREKKKEKIDLPSKRVVYVKLCVCVCVH